MGMRAVLASVLHSPRGYGHSLRAFYGTTLRIAKFPVSRYLSELQKHRKREHFAKCSLFTGPFSAGAGRPVSGYSLFRLLSRYILSSRGMTGLVMNPLQPASSAMRLSVSNA